MSQDAPKALNKTTEENKTTEDKVLTLASVQTNFLVGDIAANANKMHKLATEARDKGADIIVFSELALIGTVSAQDILFQPDLHTRIKKALQTLSTVKDIAIIVGYPHIDHNSRFNSIAIIYNGQQKGFYHKQHLSNHGAFNESRYFDKGKNHVIFDYKGVSIGLLLEEDLWNNEPIKALKDNGAELVITLAASCFEVGKYTKRKVLLSKQASTHALPISYTNCAGGQDNLVFDGGSMLVNADGEIVREAPRFLHHFLFAKFDIHKRCFISSAETPSAITLSPEAELYQALVVGLRDYVNHAGFKGVIIGLSGGIDSALTLCLATDALGSDKVYAVMMPYQYTSSMSLEDAETQAKRLNVSYTVCPIHDAVDGLRRTLAPLLVKSAPDATEENLQARARGNILMALSNRFGHLVLSTGNKSENAVGYATLYGDMVGGFDVIKDVYKTDVYRLAKYRNRLEETPIIPERVLTRPPSAELRPDQRDDDTLPDYETLDGILRLYIEGNASFEDIVAKGFDSKVVNEVISLVKKNEYKRRQGAIGTKVSSRSFDEYHYPIINHWPTTH